MLMIYHKLLIRKALDKPYKIGQLKTVASKMKPLMINLNGRSSSNSFDLSDLSTLPNNESKLKSTFVGADNGGKRTGSIDRRF